MMSITRIQLCSPAFILLPKTWLFGDTSALIPPRFYTIIYYALLKLVIVHRFKSIVLWNFKTVIDQHCHQTVVQWNHLASGSLLRISHFKSSLSTVRNNSNARIWWEAHVNPTEIWVPVVCTFANIADSILAFVWNVSRFFNEFCEYQIPAFEFVLPDTTF